MHEIRIELKQHRTTGLLMAISDDLPGFVVHAHNEDEMMQKLGKAFADFMRATSRPVRNVQIVLAESAPGFWPPAYIAKGDLDMAA